MAAIQRGVQAALVKLGRTPEYHQTDNSTAATHDLRTGKRGFNEDYEAFVGHYGMTPRTTGVGEKEQNGDVESLNGVLKRRLEQHLLLRGSRDFPDIEAYEEWLQGTIGCPGLTHDLLQALEKLNIKFVHIIHILLNNQFFLETCYASHDMAEKTNKNGAGADTEPAEVFTMTNLEQVKVLADPLRVRILESFSIGEHTTKQVAAFFGFTEHHVRRLVRLGELHAFQAHANTPGNPIRIPRAAVRRYLEKIAR